MTIEAGTLLRERYRILSLLGKGGMGEVYLAEDTSLNIQVAVKANHRLGEDATAQFFREARLLATLRHPNLPRVIDYFLHQDSQFLVMDYIQGEDLADYIDQHGPQPLERVLNWANQLGKALIYLHNQVPPVIHRDIKPANIKLTPNGEVILVDFGIAKASDTAQVTVDGASGYTPGFAPPEQYGSARTGPDSDQFSFAATLYMLLSGQRPSDALQRALGQAVLTPLTLLAPAVPPSVQAAIERALSPRREDRFPSVEDFLRALNQAAAAPHAQMPARMVPAVPAPSPADVTVASVPAKPEPSAQPPVEAPSKSVKKNRWLWLAAGAAVALSLCLIVGGVLVFRDVLGPRAQPTPAATLPLALIEPSDTSEPRIVDSPSPEPTISETPAPSQTPEVVFSPTPQPSPTEAPAPLGGGGLLVFSSNRADGQVQQLWAMPVYQDPNGNPIPGEPRQLTFDAGDKFQPAWSPDGSRLAYVAPGGTDQNGQDLGLDIWIADAQGGDAVNITRRRGDDFAPAWSTDGQRLAFTYDGREDGVLQLYLIAPDGSDLRRISADQFEFSPAWTPDMSWLLFVLRAASHNILYMRTPQDDFLELTRYDRGEVLGRQGDVEHPAVSPDGEWIAYTRLDGGRQQIFTIRFASRGADMARLTDSDLDREPAWSPDSQWVVFTSERDGNAEIYIVNRAGGTQTNLTGHPAVDMQPAWQPLP